MLFLPCTLNRNLKKMKNEVHVEDSFVLDNLNLDYKIYFMHTNIYYTDALFSMISQTNLFVLTELQF